MVQLQMGRLKKQFSNMKYFCRRARREGLSSRAGRKASATQPTFTELTGSEALDQPLQDMISYIIRSVEMLMMKILLVVMMMMATSD